MATPYMAVYNRFLQKVTDYYVFNLTDEDTCKYCHELLTSALGNLPKSMQSDLNDIDEKKMQFNDDLLNAEIEYVANRMVCEWVEPQLNNTTLTRQHVGTKDEKFFAPANQINALRSLRDDSVARTKKILRDWHYANSDYFV